MKIWILVDNLINIVRRSAILMWKARNKQLNILCVRQINQVTAKMRNTWVANLPRGRTRPGLPYPSVLINSYE